MPATHKKALSSDRAELVQRALDTYVSGDRAELEQLLAPDFVFTSPYDDHIDRATYFERCWPAAGSFAPFEYHLIMFDGNDCYVTYTGGPEDNRFHNTEKFELHGNQIVSVEVFFGMPASRVIEATSEQAIRKVLDDRTRALRDKDGALAVAGYAKDPTVFGLAPPLVEHGIDVKSIDGWFAEWTGGIGIELRELTIVVRGYAAFATALERITGTKTDGTKVDYWLRVSFGFVRERATWKIAHVHESVPFAMDGSFRALVDLKP
ncbi:MAG TPA: nuclear transport factor 2 family protein [Kofleriaceae bacterium]|jgi:ketosteroid isomerase-like protein|nr:nuclear transport factor 2 family protein [Kofleriaceae bacterium]